MSKEKQAIYEMVGAVKAFKMTSSLVDAARYSLYKQLKDSKAHRALGKEWDDFCSEDLGRARKTVDTEIKLLEEYGESFLKAAENIRLTKRDLFALGSGLSEDAKAEVKKGVIKIGEQEFKVAELEENIDEFRESITSLAKTIEDAKKDLKAAQRLTEDYRKNNEKLHKQLDRYTKKEEEKELGSEDAEFIDKMAKIRMTFDGHMLRVDPEKMAELDGEAVTERMKAAYLTTLEYMRRQILAAYETAKLRYGGAVTDPEEAWSPGKGAALGKKG